MCTKRTTTMVERRRRFVRIAKRREKEENIWPPLERGKHNPRKTPKKGFIKSVDIPNLKAGRRLWRLVRVLMLFSFICAGRRRQKKQKKSNPSHSHPLQLCCHPVFTQKVRVTTERVAHFEFSPWKRALRQRRILVKETRR